MTWKPFNIILSAVLFVSGIIYWFNNWAEFIFDPDTTPLFILSLLILFAVLLVSYVPLYYCKREEQIAQPRSESEAPKVSIKGLVMYIFASMALMINLYLSGVTIFIKEYHDFPHYFYPIIPNLFFAILFLLPSTLINRQNKKTVRNAWLMLFLSFLLAELLGIIWP